jgi:hypothetical protein
LRFDSSAYGATRSGKDTEEKKRFIHDKRSIPFFQSRSLLEGSGPTLLAEPDPHIQR